LSLTALLLGSFAKLDGIGKLAIELTFPSGY
jgi:hypothetical protein